MRERIRTGMAKARRQDGFTLIELMAVLAILALILLIAVPAIGSITAKAKGQAREASIELIEHAGELAHTNKQPFDTVKPDSVTETDIYLIPTLVETGYLKLEEDSEFYDDEQWVRKMNKSGRFEYMGKGDGSLPDTGVTPEPEVPVTPEPELLTYCPAEGEPSIYATTNLINNGIRIDGFAADYTPPSTDIIFPSMICEREVRSLGSGSFQSKGLTSVQLPELLTAIPSSAFASNALTEIVIPPNVKTIGLYAFERNKLASLTLPEGVTSISSNAFFWNELVTVDLPDTLTKIGDNTFRANKLTAIDIPDSVTSLGDGAFNVNEIVTAKLPAGLTAIPDALFHTNKLTSITIPSTVTSIGLSAFLDNDLTSVTLPASVALVRNNAFADNQLMDVTIHNPALSLDGNLMSSVFNNHALTATPALMEIHGPAGSPIEGLAAASNYTFVPLP